MTEGEKYSDISVDVTDEMVESLKSIVEIEYISKFDECTQTLFKKDEIKSLEQLQMAIGVCVVNSIFLKAIEAALVSHELQVKDAATNDGQSLEKL